MLPLLLLPSRKYFFVSPEVRDLVKLLTAMCNIEHVEIFPVDIKLDYKPRRVDYRALKEGRTIELMNFFHFDGAEMTLRHITLKGVSTDTSSIMERDFIHTYML